MTLPSPERCRNWLLLALCMLALKELGSAGLIYAKAALAPHLMARAWQATLVEGGIHKPWPWADTWPVARLKVPALQIDQFVLAGATGNALAFGPGLDAAGVNPGSAGTAVIAGHRDTHFRFLQRLLPAMTLSIELPDGRRVDYRVAESRVVDSRQPVSAPAREGQSQLELVTCYPFDAIRAGGPLRYVVRASPAANLASGSTLTSFPTPLTEIAL